MNFFREKFVLGHLISGWGLMLFLLVGALLNVLSYWTVATAPSDSTAVHAGFTPSPVRPPNLTIGTGTR